MDFRDRAYAQKINYSNCPGGPSAPMENKSHLHLALKITLSIAALVTVFLYASLHLKIILESQPLTVREYAFIDQSQQFLMPNTPGMYSYESLPEHANLYGPIYPVAAAALVSLLPSHPYIAHRLFVAGCLGLICVAIGSVIYKKAGILPALFACTFIYTANVATTSISAGPDLLMVLFYTLGICLLQVAPTRRGTPFWLLALGILIFFTKPYGILILGGYISYITLFESIKRGLGFFAVSTIAGILIAIAVSHIWPAYWFSVLVVHSKFATRSLPDLVDQSLGFGLLYFSLIVPVVVALYCRLRSLTIRSISLSWDRPLIIHYRPDFAPWISLVAASALLAFMGWHGGAYMTYFNHLLLPPLLLTCFSTARERSYSEVPLPLFLIFGNLMLLIWLLPPLPTASPTPVSSIKIRQGDTALVDPLVRPFMRSAPHIQVIDNGQSEYVVIAADRFGNPAIKTATLGWLARTTSQITHRQPTYIIIHRIHNRKLFFFDNMPSDILLANYDVIGYFDANPYFLTFRNRHDYGKEKLEFWIFKRKTS